MVILRVILEQCKEAFDPRNWDTPPYCFQILAKVEIWGHLRCHRELLVRSVIASVQLEPCEFFLSCDWAPGVQHYPNLHSDCSVTMLVFIFSRYANWRAPDNSLNLDLRSLWLI